MVETWHWGDRPAWWRPGIGGTGLHGGNLTLEGQPARWRPGTGGTGLHGGDLALGGSACMVETWHWGDRPAWWRPGTGGRPAWWKPDTGGPACMVETWHWGDRPAWWKPDTGGCPVARCVGWSVCLVRKASYIDLVRTTIHVWPMKHLTHRCLKIIFAEAYLQGSFINSWHYACGSLMPPATRKHSMESSLTFSNRVTRLQVKTGFYQLRQIRSGGLRWSTFHTPSFGLSYSPDSTVATEIRSSEHSALSIGRCYACGRPAHISTPDVSHLMRDQLHWLNAASRIPVQTVHPDFQCRNDVTPSYLASCCIPVASVIVSVFCCFRWLSRSCVFRSESRSTCVCCFLSDLLELTHSWSSGIWNQSGDFQGETENFSVHWPALK